MTEENPLAGLSDEELKALGKQVGIDVSLPPQDSPQPVDDVSIPANLMRASELEETPPEPAELGLEPDDGYRGYKILRDLPPQDERHDYLFEKEHVAAFYVRSPDGTIGLVPWLGSTVIWPWEKAWEQDLYHEKQTPERQAIMQAFANRQKAKGKK